MLDYAFLQTQMYVAMLAEEGSFSRAARRLRTSQPFLTRKIVKLEKTLGVKLFDRSTRRLDLTAAGRMLLPEVQLSLRHAERAWELAQYYARIGSGPLCVGYSPYISSALLPVLHQLDFSEFEARHIGRRGFPEPRLVLESAHTLDLVERVLRGQLHAALGTQPIHDPDLWIETIAQEPFCVCVPRNHTFAHRQSVSVRDLHGQLLFWIPRGSHPAFFDHTVEYIRSTGAHPAFHEVCSATHAIDIVSHGFGIALLPRAAARLSHTGVIFKAIADRFLQIDTAMFVRRELMRGPLQDFILFLASRLQSLKLNVQ
jgi:DNA-binding transcriptional LysR family regulator